MHQGSHHLLLYMYYGEYPEQFADGFWPCVSANCVDARDCPEDSYKKLPMGGTQVAGTKLVVEYPNGAGFPAFLSVRLSTDIWHDKALCSSLT